MKNIISNQQGSSTCIGLMLTILLSSQLILYVLVMRAHEEKLKNRSKIYLCARQYQGHTLEYVNTTEKLNIGIRYSSRASLVASLFPGLQVLKLTSKGIKTTLQKLQTVEFLSYVKDIAFLYQKSCPPDVFQLKPIYRNKRNFEGEKVLWKRRWKSLIFSKDLFLLINYKKGKKSKFQASFTEIDVAQGKALLKQLSGFVF